MMGIAISLYATRTWQGTQGYNSSALTPHEAKMGGILAAFISTHDTYMHSWGSILLQDIILPLRKKAFSPQKHIKYLRYSIIAVAVFIFIFSYFVIQKIDIIMFFALAGTIFLGAAGAVVIGGLYWKKGTAAAAWATLAVGFIMAVLGFIFVLGWTSIRAAMPSI